MCSRVPGHLALYSDFFVNIIFILLCSKKKKVKNLKKKKKKSRLKVRRHSKRSSSSSRSSSESSSESESSTQSSGSEEWVENTAAAQTKTKIDRKKDKHFKRHQGSQNARESHVHTDTSNNNKNTHRIHHRTESVSANVKKETDVWSPRMKGTDIKRERRSSSNRSLSSQSPSVNREKVKQCKNSKESLDDKMYQSPRKRKHSERESYKRESKDPTCLKSVHSTEKDSFASATFHEKSITSTLKRIREHSDKDNKLSVDYHASKTSVAGRSSKCVTATDRGSVGKVPSYGKNSSARQFKEGSATKAQISPAVNATDSKGAYCDTGGSRDTSKFHGSQDQWSESVWDRKPSLVSYEASSDEEQLTAYS